MEKRSASRFVAEIRAWGYALSGLDEVLLMGRTRAPREYISVGWEVNWDAPQGCMLIFFNPGDCRFFKAFRLIDGQTDTQVDEQYFTSYRKVCNIGYPVMSIRQPPTDSSDR